MKHTKSYIKIDKKEIYRVKYKKKDKTLFF